MEKESREMEGRKEVVSSSSSSFTSDLFGSKDSSASSSSGIFGSIFAPSSKVVGRESLHPQVGEKQPDSKSGTPDIIPRSSEGESQSKPNMDMRSVYQEERVQQPCHLSSSIYYGGQDIYSHPQSTQSSSSSTISKDGGEDDSGSASRGNWWQGSLYY